MSLIRTSLALLVSWIFAEKLILACTNDSRKLTMLPMDFLSGRIFKSGIRWTIMPISTWGLTPAIVANDAIGLSAGAEYQIRGYTYAYPGADPIVFEEKIFLKGECQTLHLAPVATQLMTSDDDDRGLPHISGKVIGLKRTLAGANFWILITPFFPSLMNDDATRDLATPRHIPVQSDGSFEIVGFGGGRWIFVVGQNHAPLKTFVVRHALRGNARGLLRLPLQLPVFDVEVNAQN
jgi:hypothetical protein